MYAYISVVFVEAEFLSDRTSDMVMPFKICECRSHLAVQPDCVKAAVLYLHVCQSLFCQMLHEMWVGLVEYQTILSDEFFSVADDLL